jgi:hypothetical protein
MNNMKLVIRTVACFLVGISLASAQKIKVEVVFDKTADFARYDTYEFKPGRALSTREPLENKTLDQQITTAILDELAERRGREDKENPDVYVTYFFGLENKTWVNRFDAFEPYQSAGSQNDPEFGQVFEYRPTVSANWKGVLVIDLIDAAGNKLVWRAYCTSDIKKPLAPEKRVSLIREAVRKAFEKYPPPAQE